MVSIKELLYTVPSMVVVILESTISFITYMQPKFVISFFTRLTMSIFQAVDVYGDDDPTYSSLLQESDNYAKEDLTGDQFDAYCRLNSLKKANNIHDMCALFHYNVENHLVRTEDDYLLQMHRISPYANNKVPNGKVVYLHHGLLMNSEIWVTMAEKTQNLPFRLCDLGYDVWLGNNRGNKYSCKNLKVDINEEQFWNFSIDEFALFDIPNSIQYILDFTKKKTVSFIGFSQGSAQIFAALSLHKVLNSQIDRLITISPATTPKGLHNWLVNSIVSMSPTSMYLVFGTKILLPSADFWKSIIYAPLFVKIIDIANEVLFNWKSTNIDYKQKYSSYYHLYSTTSVKSVVHWFQIIRSKKFQMFHDIKTSALKSFLSFKLSGEYSSGTKNFESIVFPTQTNINIPILVIYGKSDSLVDINVMKTQLPEQDLTIVGVDDYEHLDLIWGRDLENTTIGHVLRFLSWNLHSLTEPQFLQPQDTVSLNSFNTATPQKITSARPSMSELENLSSVVSHRFSMSK